MRIVTRHRPGDEIQFLTDSGAALRIMARLPGFVSGELGRSPDDAAAWIMTTRWEDAGSMRRGLSGVAVRQALAPVMATARDEAAVFEVLLDAAPDRVVIVGSDRAVEPT